MCLKSERVDESSGARSFTLHPPPAVNGRSMMTSRCCHIRGDEIWRLKNGTTILTESASANSQLLTIKQEFHWKRQRAKSARETERFNKLFYSRTVFLVVYLKSNHFILKAKYHNEASGFVFFFIEKRRKVKGEKHNITPNIWRDNNRTKITSREAGGSAEVWKTKLRRSFVVHCAIHWEETEWNMPGWRIWRCMRHIKNLSSSFLFSTCQKKR